MLFFDREIKRVQYSTVEEDELDVRACVCSKKNVMNLGTPVFMKKVLFFFYYFDYSSRSIGGVLVLVLFPVVRKS